MEKSMPNYNRHYTSNRQNGPSRQAVMRTIVLFLDGMSRGLIFPFGPSLIYRLMHGGTLKLGLDCAKVAFPLAVVVSAYILGRGTGSSIHARISINEKSQPKLVARLSGAAISLLVFTFGAGLKSVWWLLVIRFLSGVIVGILCKLTHQSEADKSVSIADSSVTIEDRDLEAGLDARPCCEKSVQREDRSEWTPETAKTYMTAFAFAILVGGLLYRHATGDATFRALTGSRQFTLSPLFLVAVSMTGESVLRCFFSFFKDSNGISESHDHSTPSSDEEAKTVEVFKTPTKSLAVDIEAPLSVSRSRTESSSSASFLRGRTETSDSEFFDCNSVLSGMEDLDTFDDPLPTVDEDDDQCIYVGRKCVDKKGAPSYVTNGDSPRVVPSNYLTLCNGNEKKARMTWEKTQRWRRQNHVWRIHTVPQRWFHRIKQAYPHFVHGVSKRGFPIIYEQPGMMLLKQLFRDGCRVDDMLQHYMFFLEFLSNHVCTREEVRKRLGYPIPPHSSSAWGILVVMDVGGAGLSHLSGDVLTYLKGAGEINNSHYPLSLKRAFLVNSPFWLAGTWRSIKGLLPDSVQVDILSSHQYLSTLREYIDDDQIPREYGGSSPHKLGEHPYESLLKDLVAEAAIGEEPDDLATEKLPSMPARVDPLVDTQLQNESALPRTESNSIGYANRRRRFDRYELSTTSPERGNVRSSMDDKKDRNERSAPGAREVWLIVSTIFILWSAVQGLIEIAIPFWILTPPELGGLGYAPSRSGVAMFSSTVVLLWVFRTKVSKALSEIPSKAPMRSFRIGAGAQTILLAILATVPRMVKPGERSDAILVMALTIIVLSGIVLSSICGRASSLILHKAALRGIDSQGVGLCGCRILGEGNSGQFTNNLKFASETLGIILGSPFLSCSLRQGRIAPFDGTGCLLLAALLALGLYVGSFSLNQNLDAEYVSLHPEGRKDFRRQRRWFLCEVFSVSVNDVVSLFDATNSSFNPFLRRQEPLGKTMCC